jgi:hypothetical protein
LEVPEARPRQSVVRFNSLQGQVSSRIDSSNFLPPRAKAMPGTIRHGTLVVILGAAVDHSKLQTRKG